MKKFGVVLFSMMFLMMGTTSCFAEKISVYDNTTKNVENFEFDDDLDIDFKLEPKEGIL